MNWTTSGRVDDSVSADEIARLVVRTVIDRCNNPSVPTLNNLTNWERIEQTAGGQMSVR